MKDFYRESEPWVDNKEEYRRLKREKVLEVIKPICDAFGITDYDYIYGEQHERLVLEGQAIGCSCNSIGATVQELIGYIFVKQYMPETYWAFKVQTKNHIKRHWIKE